MLDAAPRRAALDFIKNHHPVCQRFRIANFSSLYIKSGLLICKDKIKETAGSLFLVEQNAKQELAIADRAVSSA
ncbi:MAG: hypothetical protein ACKVQU_29215 [Burkholderiales bacterium]